VGVGLSGTEGCVWVVLSCMEGVCVWAVLSGMDGCVGGTEWYGGGCVWVVLSGMEGVCVE
jgi:hypothetical protein